MRITSITVQNFRKLFQCRIEFSEKTTLFVGANNSGKTSAMDALGKFLSNRMFSFNDITVSNRNIINKIGEAWVQPECETPVNLEDWDSVVPKMDVWLDVPCDEIYYVAGIIPTLKWRGGRLGVRLAYLPRDISKLFSEFRNAYNTARKTEKGKSESTTSLRLFPKCLCDYLEKKLTATFSMRAFILDPSKESDKFPQQTSFEMACLTGDPLKGIIKVDMIDAQRGFADPDNPDAGERVRRQLSEQMRIYYEKHLDPEKSPTVEDLELLQRTEDAQAAFDKTLADKFEPAIKELENLGYPGVADPKLTVSAKISTSDSISHSSAVQYSLSEKDDTLKLPEKYNGLGYQNLISIVFNLMGFRDGWMRIGKYDPDGGQAESAIEPLHLVLIEEPEAHLHMQVQQVFIRQAYNVLTNRKEIQENIHYKTQLIISTHSSHIAREMNFANLRYFKRLPEGTECAVATSKVINLSDVFGKEDRTDKFVTRYLQTTHCDLFFADAAILVEGAAENMLVPHFIREKHNNLNQKYISILMEADFIFV